MFDFAKTFWKINPSFIFFLYWNSGVLKPVKWLQSIIWDNVPLAQVFTTDPISDGFFSSWTLEEQLHAIRYPIKTAHCSVFAVSSSCLKGKKTRAVVGWTIRISQMASRSVFSALNEKQTKAQKSKGWNFGISRIANTNWLSPVDDNMAPNKDI